MWQIECGEHYRSKGGDECKTQNEAKNYRYGSSTPSCEWMVNVTRRGCPSNEQHWQEREDARGDSGDHAGKKTYEK